MSCLSVSCSVVKSVPSLLWSGFIQGTESWMFLNFIECSWNFVILFLKKKNLKIMSLERLKIWKLFLCEIMFLKKYRIPPPKFSWISCFLYQPWLWYVYHRENSSSECCCFTASRHVAAIHVTFQSTASCISCANWYQNWWASSLSPCRRFLIAAPHYRHQTEKE